MTYTTFIGIDPGKDGAVAIIHEGELMMVERFYKANILAELLLVEIEPTSCIAAVEELHAIFHAAANSTFSLGKSCGYWEGVFDAMGIHYQTVKPTTWQQAVTCPLKRPYTRGLPKKERAEIMKVHKECVKNESLRAAKEAFPCTIITHDGVADAINIARYAMKEFST